MTETTEKPKWQVILEGPFPPSREEKIERVRWDDCPICNTHYVRARALQPPQFVTCKECDFSWHLPINSPPSRRPVEAPATVEVVQESSDAEDGSLPET